jgi:hypothetical protein
MEKRVKKQNINKINKTHYKKRINNKRGSTGRSRKRNTEIKDTICSQTR